ncbi:CAP domain-containing protein [Levilactobacillus angrenensis]|uniref:CAP domain-containing protein n=1 Tax=Levilactobacillus angrenensis TaxID=2486020 RepID=A0ABW1U8R7_9LACO|nr:CAP domain-containing protein [Levilactobacillus angrenensis]
MKWYIRTITAGLVILVVGSVGGATPAQAKKQAKISDWGWHSTLWAKQYVVTKGPIYKSLNLKKKSKTKQKIFWSDTMYALKLTNGKRVSYRQLANKNGHLVGYVAKKHVKTLKDSDHRSAAYQAKVKKAKAKAKKAKAAEKKAFTTSERKQIATYRQQFKQIANTTKGMYVQKPAVKGHFAPGKLSAKYVNATVDSINFYRNMYGLSPVKADAAWNTEAQYGAATLAAAGKGLSHGLVGLNRPSFVSKADWQRGVDATNSSNLSGGVTKPYDNILGYVNDGDSSDLIPGHREWILGGINKVGVGQVGDYNDLKVFGDGESSQVPSAMAFPKAGVFPKSAVEGTLWSVSFDHRLGSATKPKIKVTDNTVHKNIHVSEVGTTDKNYGRYGTMIYYEPSFVKIKRNHTYTIKISNIAHQKDVTYETKLFDLKD